MLWLQIERIWINWQHLQSGDTWNLFCSPLSAGWVSITSLSLPGCALPNLPQNTAACFAVHCWFLFSLVYTRKGPRVLLSEAGFQPLSPQCAWMPGLFLHRGRTVHVSSWNFITFLAAHFTCSDPSELHPYGVSATPPTFVSSASFLRMSSDLSSRSSSEKVKQCFPHNHGCGTPLLSGLQLDFRPLTTAPSLVILLYFVSLSVRI